MVKAIRIISIAIFAISAGLLFYAVALGVGKDSKIQEFIKRPGAVEQFGADQGKTAPKDDQTSPLVKQAADLSKTLNPPPPPSVAPVTRTSEPVPMAQVITPKFNLVGTSYYPGKTGTSFALIDEPGQGLYWVREGNSVGHLLIEKVNDGSVTMRDGSRTFELKVTVKELWRDLVKGDSEGRPPTTSDTSAGSQRISSAAAPAALPGDASLPGIGRPGGRTKQADAEILRRTGRYPQHPTLDASATPNPAIQHRIKPPQPQPVTPAEQAAAISKLRETVQKQLNDAKSSRVSPEEAKRMEALAEALKTLELREKQNAGQKE
jgi:hypothetical protein